MTLAEYMIWFDEVVGPTERMIRMVPGDRLDWKLTESSFSLGQLIAHIPRALCFCKQVIRGEGVPAKNLREILVGNRRQGMMTVEEAVSQLAQWSTAFKEAVASLGEDRFQRGNSRPPRGARAPLAIRRIRSGAPYPSLDGTSFVPQGVGPESPHRDAVCAWG